MSRRAFVVAADDGACIVCTSHEPRARVRSTIVIAPNGPLPRAGPFRSMTRLADCLCLAGHRVVRADLRGFGEAGADVPEATIHEPTFAGERRKIPHPRIPGFRRVRARHYAGRSARRSASDQIAPVSKFLAGERARYPLTVSDGSSLRSSVTASRASSMRPSSDAAMAMTRSVETCVRLACNERRANSSARV